jgi:hypothetical protein
MLKYLSGKSSHSKTRSASASNDVPSRFLLGKILETLRQSQPARKRISDAEFGIYSQWGEDGIIQYILDHINPSSHVFVEFGVENYREANTRWLVEGHNWSGLVIDGNQAYIDDIKADPIYWKHQLTAVCAFVTAENINDIIVENGVSGDIGLLSVDVDGMDYWIWKALDVVSPAITIVEYNSLFGPERKVTVPYNARFTRQTAHYSWSYYGASLAALVSLGRDKGYAFVGSNGAGNNAFFVREDLVKDPIRSLSATEGYVKRKFREARDRSGKLAFPNFEQEAELISGLPVVELS